MQMTSTTQTPLDFPTRYGLVALAIVQGYALYFLHIAVEKELWLATELPCLRVYTP